jgi:hypothetical protein
MEKRAREAEEFFKVVEEKPAADIIDEKKDETVVAATAASGLDVEKETCRDENIKPVETNEHDVETNGK